MTPQDIEHATMAGYYRARANQMQEAIQRFLARSDSAMVESYFQVLAAVDMAAECEELVGEAMVRNMLKSEEVG